MVKILVVDDEKDILDLLIVDLNDLGFDVCTANNEASALGQIYRERPDIVLLDVMMPVIDGYEGFAKLRRDPSTKNLPVVLLTAISATEGEKTGFELGANHYVTKPWELDSLRAVIRVALREAENAGGANTATTGFVSTGNQLLDTKLGGGVPVSGLTVIEGGTSTGKSVLCQQFAYAGFSNGFDVAYFTIQYSPKSLVSQMGSLGLDPSMYYRSEAFRVIPLSDLNSNMGSSNILSELSRSIQELPQQYRFIIGDAVTSLVNLEDESEVQSFFTQCKNLGTETKSMVLSIDPIGLTSDTLFRVRAKSDAYLVLRLKKKGARLRSFLEVCKVRNAEEVTGNIVAFSVEPGFGMKLDVTRHAKASLDPRVRVNQRSYDEGGLGIS